MADDNKKNLDHLFVLTEDNQQSNEKINRPVTTFLQDAFRSLRRNVAAMISLVVLIIIIVMAAFGGQMNEYDSTTQNLSWAKMPPKVQGLENIGWLGLDGTDSETIEASTVEAAKERGLARFKNDEEHITFDVKSEGDGTEDSAKVVATHDVYASKDMEDTYFWFGTDGLGRDLWTRTWEGTRISLFIAFLAAAIDLVIGVAYGGISGYYGGRADNVMQRIIEIITGIPNLVVLILMIIIMGSGIVSISLALAITGWTGMARIVRGEVLKLKNQEFVLASRTLGAPNGRIISRHLIPNVASLIIINTMFTIPSAIFFEAFLSFIGLGLQPPTASLGTLIDDGFKSLTTYPHMLIFPAILISVIMIAFNLLGDGLRDAFDPKMRK
ncbi:hypothetical protein Pryu01_01677 [Paraliobacillus ryukyuensis]|uniref:Oligopeptide transport system permease protein n=1 Tax=Paraliobacillus ryukyuensis TaxID=200904 RepID=A0A366E738_9BACI|nr:oligopeptide ABC transporter permease [Paraliobacillus ryukyuensis]RBO98193.1 oligopeptide transport system permease protein [Paraliobacillus ryukyuensis]